MWDADLWNPNFTDCELQIEMNTDLYWITKLYLPTSQTLLIYINVHHVFSFLCVLAILMSYSLKSIRIRLERFRFRQFFCSFHYPFYRTSMVATKDPLLLTNCLRFVTPICYEIRSDKQSVVDSDQLWFPFRERFFANELTPQTNRAVGSVLKA